MRRYEEIKERLIINCNYTWNFTYKNSILLLSIWGTLFTLLPVDIKIISMKERIFMILAIVILMIIVGVFKGLFSKSVTVKNYDNKRIQVMYGDLISIAFVKDKRRKIVVIPVNRCFDIIVDDKTIESSSIHGQWLKAYLKSGETIESLDKQISIALKDVQCQELSKKEKPEGKKKRYPLGTLVEIEGKNNTIFYLLAFTELDENLTAHCSRAEYFECLQYLVEQYNISGHAIPLYMPTMGCEFARINLSLSEAVEAITAIWKINKDKLLGDVNIVVYEKQKNVLAITNFKNK